MGPYDKNYDYSGAYNQAVNNYNTAAQSTQQRQNQLADYSGQVKDYGQLYGQYLTGAQQMYGFNPQDLLQAQKNLANTNTQIANLPQAVQQQGNYYGTTAGAQANNYSQQAGNLNALLAGQANTAGVYNNVLNATQTQANQQAGLTQQSQALQANILQAVLDNALGFQQAQQGRVNSAQTQQQNYGSYLNAQIQAQAAAQQAAAQSALAKQQAAQLAQQIAFAQQYADQQKALQQGSQQGGNSNVIPLGVAPSGLQGNGMRLQ